MNSPTVPTRQHRRIPARQQVQVSCATWDQFHAVYTQNISRGGVFITTDDPPPMGSRLEIHFALPGNRDLVLQAEVRHVSDAETAVATGRPVGVGAEFVNLDDAQAIHIETLLEIAEASTAEPASLTWPATSAPEEMPSLAGQPDAQAQAPPSLPAPEPSSAPVSGLDAESLFAQMGDPFDTGARTRASAAPAASAASAAPAARSAGDSERFTRAQEHAAAQRNEEAAAELKALSAARPDDLEMKQLLFLVQARQAKIERRVGAAIAAYSAVLEIDESNEEAANEVRWLHEEKARKEGLFAQMKRKE